MTITYNKTRAHVHLDAIVKNFKLVADRVKRPMPVIKSDAYGHGVVEVGLALEAVGAREAGIGMICEGVTLRKGGFKGDIVALLGAHDDADAMDCVHHDIIPMVFDMAGLERMAKAYSLTQSAHANPAPVRIGLKFDTGMARLGFTEHDVPTLCQALKAYPMLNPYLAASHLAVADDPKQMDATKAQGDMFARIMHGLREHYPQILGSLANTAASLAYPELHWDIQRPGIALYGSNPLRHTELESFGAGLTPTMSVETPILQVHALPKGKTSSYGRTFTADKDMTVAVIAAGYADIFSRSSSNKGYVLIHGQRAPILGRVCMQTCMVDVSHIQNVAAGDAAWLMGEPNNDPNAISCDELADIWGTISYEALCLLGMNTRIVE
ncbi:MAG: alanine racemase [Pseudomonadota bacterium]